MAVTSTSNAVGTAKQFTPQPQNTYQRNLMIPSFGGGIQAAKTNKGAELAQSLGIVSAALGQYNSDYDKRQKEIADAVVPIIYGREDHDIRLTMDGIAMVNKAGIGDLQDNPYALALIDQLKGQEISSEIHKRYQAYTSQERLKGTLQEEIKSYDEFFNDNVQEYLDKTTINNAYAMDNGLYESRVVNTGKVAQQFVADKATEMSINRAETISTFVSENTRNRWNWTDDEMNTFSNQIGNLLSTTQERDPTKNYQIMDNMLKNIAENTGNWTLIEKLKDTPVYGNQKLSDFIDVEKYKDLADESNKKHWMEITRNIYDKVSACTDKKSLYAYVDGLSGEEKSIASSMIGGRIAAIEAEERQKKAIELAAQKAQQKAIVGNLNLDAQLNAVLNGQTKDSMGNAIALSAADYKTLGFTDTDIQTKINGILSNLNPDNPDDVSKFMRLVYHPAFKKIASETITNYAAMGLNSLTPDNPTMSPMLQEVVNLYTKVPGYFNDVLSDASVKADIMCVASFGVDKYLQVKDTLNDSGRLQALDNEMSDYVSDGISTLSLPSLDDGTSYEGFSYTEPNSAQLRDTYRNYARVYRAMGFSPTEAVRQTNYRIASEYFAFNGCPIPVAATKLCDIGGTPDDVCRSAFQWVLRSRFNEYCSSNGIDPSMVTVTYNNQQANGTAVVSFVTSAGVQTYPLNTLVEEARANLQQSGNQVYDAPAEETETPIVHGINDTEFSTINNYQPTEAEQGEMKNSDSIVDVVKQRVSDMWDAL